MAKLFLAYVLHGLNHRLYQMEPWLADHQTMIEQITGWQFTSKDATDDRLATLIQALGADDSVRIQFQQCMGQLRLAWDGAAGSGQRHMKCP